MGKFFWAVAAGALALVIAVSPLSAQGKKVALVSAVKVDSHASVPAAFSAEVLRRELQIALEATGLFTVPTVEKTDLEPVLNEFIRTHRSSARLIRAQFILSPVIDSITLDSRRRQAPNMRGKDLVVTTGTVAMTVTVFTAADGSVQARLPIAVTYDGPSHLEDPLNNDQLVRRDAVHYEGTTQDFIGLSKAIGRVFAKRVLDQVNPVIVAQVSGTTIYLTRGEDAGYRIGETLRIIRLGGDIRHPITHELLGHVEREVGQARVTEVQPRLSIAEIVQSSSPVLANDIVREPVDAGGE